MSFDDNEELFIDKLRQLESNWQTGQSVVLGSVWLEKAKELEHNVALADKEMYRDKSRYYEEKKHDRRRRKNVGTEDMLKTVDEISEFLPGVFFVYHADENYVEYRIICKDGAEKYVRDYGRFVHTELYGDVYYVFINDVTRDIVN